MEAKLQSDRSVSRKSDDLLNRTKLTDEIADYIRDYILNENNPLTIGLQGEWGIGKSSMMNFIAENLKHPKSEQKIVNSSKSFVYSKLAPQRLEECEVFPAFEVIELNSWGCNSYEQLVAQFFKQLSSQLEKYDNQSNENRFKKLIHDYSVVLIGLGGLIPKVGGIISALNQLPENKEIPETVSELKKKISDKLVNSNVKVIIMIDDSDRLLPDQLLTMLQFITVSADFDNIVFVIAYNETYYHYVWSSHFSQNKNDKDDNMVALFLEKIFTAVFTIPKPEKKDIQSYFSKIIVPSLARLLKTPAEIHFNQIVDIFAPEFTSVRQIKRFNNYLLFNKGAFSPKLDAYDFIALKLIEFFDPELYKQMSSGFENFSKSLDATLQNNSSEKFEVLIGRVFRSSRIVPVTGLRITNKEYFPLFFLGGVELFSPIDDFIDVCKGTENQESQLFDFFSKYDYLDILKFRESLKKYFLFEPKSHKDEAQFCLKALLENFDSFEPFPDGVFEQDASSQVKFEYAMMFLPCLDKKIYLELFAKLFECDKMHVGLYFYEYFILLQLDRSVLELKERIELTNKWQESIQSKKDGLWQQDAFWFSSFFLMLLGETISSLPATDKVDEALRNSTEALNYLFGLWTLADEGVVDDGFAKMISPFFPASVRMRESGEPSYYFVRSGQYSSYIGRCTDKNINEYERLEDLYIAFSEEILKYIKDNLEGDQLHKELAIRLAVMGTYSKIKEKDPSRFDSIPFTGISEQEIRDFCKELINNE